MRYTIGILAIIIAMMSTFGCSGGNGNSPITPGRPAGASITSDSHQLWGLWQFTADPAAGTLDIVPLRTTAMHVNVVPILEPPAGMKLKIANLKFAGLVCDVDVTLVHPFPGLSQYIGFDVAGIFISKGTLAGFGDPDLMMSGAGETRMLNPDGYTRWWNPSEFSVPGQPILRYKDGLLGSKNASANFNCTLNGYKLFGDSLAKETELLSLSPTNRVPFLNGTANTRHYTIDFAGGVVFNYAVDANWEPVEGTPPFTPYDYIESANRPEAWAVSITELENSLWNDGAANGGDLSLQIDVWDHFNAGLNSVKVESPGNFDAVISATPIGGGEGYSTYQVDIIDATPLSSSLDILLSIESEVVGYWDVLPDNHITSYFLHTSEVSSEQTTFAPTALMHATTPTSINADQSVSFDATESTGTPPLTFTWDFNGDGIYDGAGDDYTGAPETPTHNFTKIGDTNVTVKVTNAKGFDISDPVLVQVAYDPLDIFVDADYTGGDSNGTPAKPYTTIQLGMNAVTAGHKVHVDYCDGGSNYYDVAGLNLKSNTTLVGDNWNGGGPGKPKIENTTNFYVIGGTYSVNSITIDGFEMKIPDPVSQPEHFGAYFLGGSNITIRHNKITGYGDDTGLSDGDGDPVYFSNTTNAIIEFNEIGPITWHSDSGGEYATVMLCIASYENNNINIRNNYIHDITVDYSGGGNIRLFGIYLQCAQGANVNNNLLCHFVCKSSYSYRIMVLLGENLAFPTNNHHFYNNTVDYMDTTSASQYSNVMGMIMYSFDMYATGSYCNNTLLTNFKPNPSNAGSAYSGTSAYTYPLTYSTGYHVGSITNYFSDWVLGNGCTDYPGIDPKYVNNNTEPYDYHFESGSGCEMGDPNFIDWDDTGAPSGDPAETNIQNRSRMGCFGGPDGDWDPNNL
jgi:hypothetical protein